MGLEDNISQLDLSFKAGLSQNMVNRVETGRMVPTIKTILKICNALDVNPSTLLDASSQERHEAKETVLKLVARYM